VGEAEKTSARGWLIWLAAALIYLLAVFHRASFGVAGLQATERFHLGATALASFAVLQLGVYAAMQIPTGVLVDRYGPRRVLVAAVLAIGGGQLVLALADSYPMALLARGILGFGDALTFVAVLRIVAEHIPRRHYPLVATLTTAMGYVGNLAATVPLAASLGDFGWTPTFLITGIGTLAYGLIAALFIRNTPRGKEFESSGPVHPRAVGARVTQAWRTPGTRLGFWVHFATMFAPNVLTLLWGVPYLVGGQGLSASTASALLMVFVFGSMAAGPMVGALVSKRPGVRIPLVAGYLLGALLVWALLLGTSGPQPVAVLAVCFAWLSLGGPASTIGFALARDYNPMPMVGTATGVVNVGGFTATTLTALAIGVLLQWTGSYRVALLAVPAVLLFGTWRTLVWWRRARAFVLHAQDRGDEVIPFRIRRRRLDAPLPV
jgi:MFS family permease